MKESSAEGIERADHVGGPDGSRLLPTFDGDVAAAGIDGENEFFRAELGREIAGERDVDCSLQDEGRAENHATGSEIQCSAGRIDRANASTYLAGDLAGDLGDQILIGAAAHGGVEVDDLDERIFREAIDP